MKKARHIRRHRGGALIVALIMTFLVIAIAGVSLSLVSTNRRITDAHYTYHAMAPVAERGIDQAMKVINKYLIINKPGITGKLSTKDPSGSSREDASWSCNGRRVFANGDANLVSDSGTYSYFKDFGSSLSLGEGHNCTLKVKVLNIPTTDTDLPFKTYAVAEVSSPGTSYTRQFLASFSANSSQAPGMVSMQLISFTGGNVFIAAYDSTKGLPTTFPDTTNLSSDVTVATFYAKDLDLGQVNVYGFVSTIPGTDADFAKNAHIWDVKSNTVYQSKGVDGYIPGTTTPITDDPTVTPNILDNFTLNPDDFQIRSDADILSAVKTNFPGYTAGALPPKTASNTITASNSGDLFIGASKTPITEINAASVTAGVYYMDSSIDIGTKTQIAIKGNVTLINKTSANSFSASGQGNLLIQNTSSSFSIYTTGDVTVGGNGVMGAADTTVLASPKQFLVSGINPTPGGQTITFNGNGAFVGMIYAPDANLYLKGGGSSGTVRGSIVAYTISANGVTNFYYDKNLASAVTPQYRLNSITELTGANKVSM